MAPTAHVTHFKAVGCYQRYAEMFEEAAKALDTAFTRSAGALYTCSCRRCFFCFTRAPDFRTYAQVQRSHPLAQGNDLHSLLIKPIQRLPRYKLLLEQLHKTCCNAAAAVGGRGVNGAATAADATAACVALVDEATIFINERKRDAGKTDGSNPFVSQFISVALVWFVCLIYITVCLFDILRQST
jgi:hypothetical protein